MIQVGEFGISLVSDGVFRVDGGAMFGVVPKPLWQRLIAPDEQNRVLLGTNCLLLRSGRDAVLIEAGLGRKLSKKKRDIYAVTDAVTLEASLRAAKTEPEAVTHVVLTHLHFDHCGGATKRDKTGRIVPTFPHARHYVQRVEWEAATRLTPATDTAYERENFDALEANGLLELVDGEAEIRRGIRAVAVPGHTRAHQIVRVESGGTVLVFLGDLIPTTHHVRTHYNTAYDLNLEAAILNKVALLDEACRQGWWLVFYHDAEVPIGTVKKDALGHFVVTPLALDTSNGPQRDF